MLESSFLATGWLTAYRVGEREKEKRKDKGIILVAHRRAHQSTELHGMSCIHPSILTCQQFFASLTLLEWGGFLTLTLSPYQPTWQ